MYLLLFHLLNLINWTSIMFCVEIFVVRVHASLSEASHFVQKINLE